MQVTAESIVIMSFFFQEKEGIRVARESRGLEDGLLRQGVSRQSDFRNLTDKPTRLKLYNSIKYKTFANNNRKIAEAFLWVKKIKSKRLRTSSILLI